MTDSFRETVVRWFPRFWGKVTRITKVHPWYTKRPVRIWPTFFLPVLRHRRTGHYHEIFFVIWNLLVRFFIRKKKWWHCPFNPRKKLKPKNDNNNHDKYNSGNFICVFECTIVNLATYRQFTNAAWDWNIKKKQNKTKQKGKKEKKRKEKKRNQNCIKSRLSQFLFLQQKM